MSSNERMPLGKYLLETCKTADGVAWLLVCGASLICLLDLALSTQVIPIRDAINKPKAVVLLGFSPLLVFLLMVLLRQLPFANAFLVPVFRASLCILTFLLINF